VGQAQLALQGLTEAYQHLVASRRLAVAAVVHLLVVMAVPVVAALLREVLRLVEQEMFQTYHQLKVLVVVVIKALPLMLLVVAAALVLSA
jgi:ABC-type phosphate transport system permease subunit